ncbi:hypothetical protein QBC41DRAFT_336099 [Cercophora samala]|uniref:Uncharacterized protein n=1 Tax=Cercophora samala TaxID=330535 RepID=A0AA40DB95_9PEZI|nr:hypothetical protein QBC41DRAFT_336099 [Cercophora samala]
MTTQASERDVVSGDWVFSYSSAIHIAIDKGWFTSFEPWETTVTYTTSENREPVTVGVSGVGTVSIPIQRTQECKEHPGEPGCPVDLFLQLTLVLYAPDFCVNICKTDGMHLSSTAPKGDDGHVADKHKSCGRFDDDNAVIYSAKPYLNGVVARDITRPWPGCCFKEADSPVAAGGKTKLQYCFVGGFGGRWFPDVYRPVMRLGRQIKRTRLMRDALAAAQKQERRVAKRKTRAIVAYSRPPKVEETPGKVEETPGRQKYNVLCLK